MEQRRDITGLRAAAIIPVVLFHAGVPFLQGGFIGVDVFFVISGFLIIGLLTTEYTKTSRIDAISFISRRVKRIVPATSVMVAATLLLIALFAPATDWVDDSKIGAAAATYLSNLLFVSLDADYFAQDWLYQNPFLHTWTLGVEIQFYLAVALFMMLVILIVAKRWPRLVTKTVAVTLGLFAGLSLLASHFLTSASPSLAYFVLTTRLWEFSIGGLTFLLTSRFKPGSTFAGFAGFTGIAMIILGTVTLNELVPYPGTAALLPVIGASLILLAGSTATLETARGTSWVNRILSTQPAFWIGELSFSWYLWHWPIIMLAALLFEKGGTTPPLVMAAAVLLGLLFSVLSLHFVENPVRRHPKLRSSNKRSLMVGMAFIAGALAFALLLGYAGNAWEKANPGAAKLRVGATHKDNSKGIYKSFGDLNSKRVVLVVGDSHARTWLRAFKYAAASQHFRLDAATMNACPPLHISTLNSSGRPVVGCEEHHIKLDSMFAHNEYYAVIISLSEAYEGRILGEEGGEISVEAQRALWQDRYEALLNQVSTSTDRIGVIDDNPRFLNDPTVCFGTNASSTECTVPLYEALQANAGLKQGSVTARDKFGKVDEVFYPIKLLCQEGYCHLSVDGKRVMRDETHFMPTWVRAHYAELDSFVSALLAAK